MKIICIGRNYASHAQEMHSEIPAEPIIFMKPDTASLNNKQAFYLPDFSSDIHHEVEVVLKINKEGKNIKEKFAHKYFQEISIGIDFTARDIQQNLKKKGLPWELSKSFDNSAATGNFIQIQDFNDINNLSFSLKINDHPVQEGNTSKMLFSFDKIISFISKYITLRKGDLIYTGTPSGVGPVKAGDKLEGFIENQLLLEVLIK